ncbi:unnamed protein product [Gongylonema pulchrum]|uniref:Secreted protein n=1 Tax=Gongylonema pulchrum TaxID=637853 RepID=A0A183DPC9_9BILA|nr:unnamed protein product [Gongylonema pulchrum]
MAARCRRRRAVFAPAAALGCSRAGPMIDEVDEQGFGYEQPPRTCDLFDMEWRRGGGQFGVRWMRAEMAARQTCDLLDMK